MRRLLVLATSLLTAFALAGTASAAPLKWSGTSNFVLGTGPPVILTGTGVATVNGSSGFGHLNTLRLAGGITGTVVVPITDPEVTVDGIVAIANTVPTAGTGTFAPISGGGPLTQNVLPVLGLAKVCLFDPACLPGGFLPLSFNAHKTGSTTVGLGVGGLLTVGGAGMIRVSVLANPWTIQTATALDQTDNGAIITRTLAGFIHGPASLTSSTAQPSGVIQLVTPTQVSTNLTVGSNEVISLLGYLRIHFVPEPGMLLLLGSGVAALALLGRGRMKS